MMNMMYLRLMGLEITRDDESHFDIADRWDNSTEDVDISRAWRDRAAKWPWESKRLQTALALGGFNSKNPGALRENFLRNLTGHIYAVQASRMISDHAALKLEEEMLSEEMVGVAETGDRAVKGGDEGRRDEGEGEVEPPPSRPCSRAHARHLIPGTWVLVVPRLLSGFLIKQEHQDQQERKKTKATAKKQKKQKAKAAKALAQEDSEYVDSHWEAYMQARRKMCGRRPTKSKEAVAEAIRDLDADGVDQVGGSLRSARSLGPCCMPRSSADPFAPSRARVCAPVRSRSVCRDTSGRRWQGRRGDHFR